MRIVSRFREQLAMLYHGGVAPEEMRAARRRCSRAGAELRALDQRYGVKSALAAELDGKPNNARLASLATYYECVPGFERLLAEQQHDLPRFYAAVRALAKLPRDERHAQLCAARAGGQLKRFSRLPAGPGADPRWRHGAAHPAERQHRAAAAGEVPPAAEHRSDALLRANRYTDRRLGQSFGYGASGISLTIYVYDFGLPRPARRTGLGGRL